MWWTSNCSLLLIYLRRKDERLSQPSWLTYRRRFTHISGHPSAAGRAQDGLTENDGHENDGPSKLQGMKLQDMKMTDQIAGHEIAGHENAGHENTGHENARLFQ